MFKTYAETLDYLYGNLPMFQRVGATAYKKDLTNTIALCEAIGNPHHQLRFIHVAGTNGKGSTAHMMAAILQSAGFKTGLYTSPHLKSFTERIRVNGREMDQDFVVDFMNRIRVESEKIKPSFFELTVAMAFDYFARQQVDVAVIEVGLGGRLDSTNVITPELAVITNIGFDHMDILGHTLPEIAFEKAGIIKNKIPVVVSERQPEVEKVFMNKAMACGTQVFFADDYWRCQWNDDGSICIHHNGQIVFESILPSLKGNYQLKNIAGVLMSSEILKNVGWHISLEHVRQGIENTVSLTGLKGRWQVLQNHPRVICDTAHNESGVREVMAQLLALSYRKLHIVWGMVKDKDRQKILQMLPPEAIYYFCQADLPRALDANQLASEAAKLGLQGTVVKDVNQALRKALLGAANEDIIFVGGSTFVVAEIETL